jgi:hypothetical protein
MLQRASVLLVVLLGSLTWAGTGHEAASTSAKASEAVGPADDSTQRAVAAEITASRRIEITVAHAFSRSDARERIVQLLDYWTTRFGVRASWAGFRVFLVGQVWGIDFRGLFEIGEHEVAALAVDPGFLRQRASSYVEQKLKKYLSPTYADP